MSKNVFIIGSRGIPARYGGFETFAQKLVEHKKNPDIKYFVASQRKNNTPIILEDTFEYFGATVFQIDVGNFGGATPIVYDIKSIRWVISYVKKNSIDNAVIYILLIMMFYTNQIRQISISYITAYSLFWPLRYKSLIEAGVNLLISLVLVIKYQMGVNGVLIGTIIANIGINIIWEGHIVQRLALSNSTLRYFWSLSKVSLVTVVSVWFGINIQQILNINNDLIKMIALTGIYIVFMLIIILVFSFIIPESKNLYKRIIRN